MFERIEDVQNSVDEDRTNSVVSNDVLLSPHFLEIFGAFSWVMSIHSF